MHFPCYFLQFTVYFEWLKSKRMKAEFSKEHEYIYPQLWKKQLAELLKVYSMKYEQGFGGNSNLGFWYRRTREVSSVGTEVATEAERRPHATWPSNYASPPASEPLPRTQGSYEDAHCTSMWNI